MASVREPVDGRRGFAASIRPEESCGLRSMKRVCRRFAKFTVVGASGVVVQTLMLAFLLRVAGVHYLIATALAVEASVLNNFAWHSRWTWADRPAVSAAQRLLRFNATNGAMSLAGNLLFMFLLVRGFEVNPHAANLLTIGICSIINFALADRVVFLEQTKSDNQLTFEPAVPIDER